MSKTYNGLAKPILLFNKEGEVFVPKPNPQPSYGIWESLEAARVGLIEEFENISNVPNGYTFAIINDMDLPEEWWFTRDGDWSSIERKGVSLFMLDIIDNMLKVSYDGGWTWVDVGELSDPTALTDQIILDVTNDGVIRISFNSGTTWHNAGQIKLRISDSGYLYITYDNWAHETLVGKVGGSSSTPSGGGSAPVANLDSQNIDGIPYEGVNDSESHTYVGQEACDLLVYFGIDQINELNSYLEENYPNASVGDYVIIRSTLYDRTGGMSNDSDGTHTYELDPTWTTQEILDNSSQDDWYHFYKVTKVGDGVWAAISWIGRVPVYQDVTHYTITIGTVNPQDAVVTVSYNDVVRTVQSGDTISIPEGTTVTVSAERAGYESYSDTFTMTQDQTVNISLEEIVTGYTITIGTPKASDGTIISNAVIEWRYIDALGDPRGRRVYPGEVLTVQPNQGVYFEGTATGYYDWKYSDTFVPVTQSFTLNPVFTKIPDTKTKVVFDIRARDFDPVEGTYTVGGPGQYGGHYELEYWINNNHYVEDMRTLGSSIELDKGDYFECYLRVVDSSIPWTEEHKSRQKITRKTTLTFYPEPANYTHLSFINASPSSIYIYVNNSQMEHTPSDVLYFHYGATVHIEGRANGYITKTWDLVMPEQEHYTPSLALDPISQ